MLYNKKYKSISTLFTHMIVTIPTNNIGLHNFYNNKILFENIQILTFADNHDNYMGQTLNRYIPLNEET